MPSLHGHSGGAQFVHRFAMAHPETVLGVSAHSAGSWACDGGYGSIRKEARGVPFLISCGEKDTGLAYEGSPHPRIEWFRLFEAGLKKGGFVYWSQSWPDHGHGVPMKLYGRQLRECFDLAAHGKVPTGAGWQGDLRKLTRARLSRR